MPTGSSFLAVSDGTTRDFGLFGKLKILGLTDGTTAVALEFKLVFN